MESYFSSQFFSDNRRQLRQLFTGTAPIVITANGLLQRGGDDTYAFSQDASFWYLTGIDEPDIVLVIDKDKDYLIVPSRSDSRETFDGRVNYQALSQRSGIEEIYDGKDGWKKLGTRLKRVKHVATLASASAYIELYGFYTNPARIALARKLKSHKADIKLLDLSPHLMRLRVVKQPEEIKAIQKAIDITAATLKEITKPAKMKSYAREYQIEAELSRGFRSRGADGHSFSPVVASGIRACTLHNSDNLGQISAKDLIVVDVGAEVEHYAADITRTYIIGRPTKRQQMVHQAVLDVQDYALGLVKPGASVMDNENKIEHYMGEKLRELGLIKTITSENVRRYYPHSTSHYLGLNVHDIGDRRLPLVSGAVITVEPGIYIKEEGIAVRIEDDVLVTDKGAKVLSLKLPSTLQ